MSKSQLKTVIIVLGLATALIHAYLNVRLGRLDVPFTLNALGYLVLTFVFARPLPMLAGKDKLVHYAFMGFTVLTILGWLALGNKSDLLGIVDKVIEVLLLVALWLHLKAVER